MQVMPKNLPKLLKISVLPSHASCLKQKSKTDGHINGKHHLNTLKHDWLKKNYTFENWLRLVSHLSQAQASLILQLRTGHIDLNKHLHQINCINSPLTVTNTPQRPSTTTTLNATNTIRRDRNYEEINADKPPTSPTYSPTHQQLSHY